MQKHSFSVLVACAVSALAQAPPKPRFEVASIRPSATSPGGTDSEDLPGRYTATKRSLKDLIREAWDIRDYQISGPDWLATERFNIVAKAPIGASKKQLQLMKQALLEERFGLQTHFETRNLPVYGIIIAKNGVRFQPSSTDAPPRNTMNARRGAYDLKATRKSMVDLAEALSYFADRPVKDMTGLTGIYDYTLEWMADEAEAAARESGTKGEIRDDKGCAFNAVHRDSGHPGSRRGSRYR